MKILICGPDTEKNRRVVAAIRAQWPDAELIFERDLVKTEEPEPQAVWVDEVSEFREINEDVWDCLLTNPPAPVEPQVAPKTGWKAIRQEKTAPVWTRRKKR